jgi:hypothetical protein
MMATLFGLYPFLIKLYADGGYQGAGFQHALRTILKRANIEIVKRSAERFAAQTLDRRRTFAWLGRCRRLAKGLGMSQPQGGCLPQARLHPPHAAKAVQSKMMFPDRL